MRDEGKRFYDIGYSVGAMVMNKRNIFNAEYIEMECRRRVLWRHNTQPNDIQPKDTGYINKNI